MGEEDSVSESEGYGQEEESKSPFKMPNSRIPAYDTFKIKACVLRAKQDHLNRKLQASANEQSRILVTSLQQRVKLSAIGRADPMKYDNKELLANAVIKEAEE